MMSTVSTKHSPPSVVVPEALVKLMGPKGQQIPLIPDSREGLCYLHFTSSGCAEEDDSEEDV